MGDQILVVDDDSSILFSTKRLLEVHDFEVDTAINWREALEQVSNKNYDLIILDIMMPEVTGTELFHKIKATNPDTKIMYLTATVQTEEIKKQVEEGQAYFMQKPYDPVQIIHVAKQITKE